MLLLFRTVPSALNNVIQLRSGTYIDMILANGKYDDNTLHSQHVHELILLQCIYSLARQYVSVDRARQMFKQLNLQ